MSGTSITSSAVERYHTANKAAVLALQQMKAALLEIKVAFDNVQKHWPVIAKEILTVEARDTHLEGINAALFRGLHPDIERDTVRIRNEIDGIWSLFEEMKDQQEVFDKTVE